MSFSFRPSSFLTALAAVASLSVASCALAEPEPEVSAAAIEKGKQTYVMFCQPCHGAEDAGIDSPSNLFDTKWYHGEGRDGIEKTIRDGIMDKGMPAWGQMISNEEIVTVIDYLLSFQKPENSSHD